MLTGLDRDLVVELALAVIEGKRALVIAELFEASSILADQVRNLGSRAGKLVLRELLRR